MQFLTENFVLIAVALASGAMLLWPMVQRRASGPALDTLGATRFINDSGAIVLDVREPAEFAAGHLPNARNIPLGELDKRVGDLPKDKPVLVCCASGARSGKALSLLRQDGREAFNLSGGVAAWQQAGLPVVKKK
ncbi:MAG: rhodanese-like domain-containing protein [Gammaproteobacteria bacterium]